MAIDPARGASYTDLQSLTSLKRDARAQDPTALRETARQFESVFTRMLLKSMRQASQGDALFDSQQSGFYRDMFDDQLAVEMSRGKGLGLAEMMVEQLLRANAGQSSAAATAITPGKPGGDAAASTGSSPTGPTASTGAAAAGRSFVPASGTTPEMRESFVREMLPYARDAAQQLGVEPRTLIAHAALETGWGRSMPRGPGGEPSYNLFGIKAGAAWRGDAVNSTTTEYEAGVAGTRVERFRAYGSAAGGISDYVELLKGSPRYAAALGTGGDSGAFALALHRGGYATDPDYARKLSAVADGVGAILDGGLKPGNELPIPPAEGTT